MYRSVTVNDNHHAGYYPGAKPLLLKLLWDPETGRVLGAQVTGFLGVDKRLDVMATAIMGGLTIDDLAQLELAYAPPFGSAKDIVNLAGFTACNARDGLVTPIDSIPNDPLVQVVDTRPAALVQAHPLTGEFGEYPARGTAPAPRRAGPPSSGGDRLRPRKVSLFAARILAQNGFQVSTLTGGIRAHFDPRTPAKLPTP